MRKPLLLVLGLITSPVAYAEPPPSMDQDVQKMVIDGIDFAKGLLRDFGTFYPFGRVIDREGELGATGAYTGEEFPEPVELIEVLKSGFVERARSGEYRATALFYDIRITSGDSTATTDAVAIEVDHQNDYSVVFFLPYEIVEDEVTFMDMGTEPGKNEIFNSEPTKTD